MSARATTAVLAFATGALALLPVMPAAARIMVPVEHPPPAVRVLLDGLDRAFRDGDHEALVSLLHPHGVRICLGPQADRASVMTPAQAHYYFKNLFQMRRTSRFALLKRHQSEHERFLAMAVWHWEEADGGRPATQRLLFDLVKADGLWRVAEITALRGG